MIDKNFYYLDISGRNCVYYELKDNEFDIISSEFKGLNYKVSNIGTHYNGKAYTSTICFEYNNLSIKARYTNDRNLIIDFLVDNDLVGYAYFAPHGRDPATKLIIIESESFLDRVKAISRKNKLYKIYGR